jgi:hypothetical protein
MDLPFRIPGTTGPEIIVRRSPFGTFKVLVDGVPVNGRRGRFPIHLSDGTVKELRLTGQWTGLKAVVDGVESPLEPPIPRFLLVLIFLPFAVGPFGGMIGGAFGGLGVAVNTGVARLRIGTAGKVFAMLGVAVLAAALYVVTAVAFRNAIAPVATLDVGICINGVAEGQVLDSFDPVSCATPHDGEVVGSATHPGASAYPSEAALADFAATPCIAAFNSYVGRDFQISSLAMLPLVPTESTWATGDRAITCVVLADDGSKLTMSVKGSRL